MLILCPSAVIAETSVRSEPQTPQFLKKKWTTEDGLPQNTVTAMVQTQDGYLWLGTFGGLVRFDGLKFTIFNTANSPTLTSNRIMSLYEDKEETLWIGTETGGILRYRNRVFEIFEQENGKTKSFVKNFLVDQSGALWVAGNWGVKRFENKDPARMTLYPFERGVTSITEDPSGEIWCATEEGIAHWQNGKFDHFVSAPGSVSNQVSIIKAGADGTIWTVDRGNLGFLRDGKLQALAQVERPGLRYLVGIAADREGYAWYSFYENLYRFGANGTVEKFSTGDITANGARSMIFDREGNLWIGTNGDGLVRLRRKEIQTISKIDGLISDEINVVADDPDGGIWIGALNLTKWENGKISRTYTTADGLPGAMINALAFDRQNALWIGTFSGGVGVLKDGRITTIIKENRVPVKSVFADSRNRIWVGRLGGGLQVLENGQVTTYAVENGLVNNDVRFITEDRAGAIWVGTVGGMSKFTDGIFINYTTENGLSNNFVREIREDSDGTLWIGTYGGGLNRFRNGEFAAITAKDGLFDDFVSRIIPDDRDDFWILGNRGIFSVSRRSLNEFIEGRLQSVFCNSYGVADGMLSSEGSGGNQPAGSRMSDGRLSFPTIRGVVIFDPTRQREIAPPVYIEDVRLDRAPLDPGGAINIKPGQDNLEISYTGLNFGKPELVRFRYKLEGLDDEWTEAGTRRVAYFPHLPPGNYVFTVTAATSDTVWSPPAMLAFTVLAPFWQRGWFIALVVISIFGLIAISYQLRLNHLKKRQATQEEFSRRLINAHESERQRVASELHDGLGQSLLVIKNRSLLGEMNGSGESARDQFRNITEAAAQALEEVRHITYNLRPYHLNRLGLTQAIEAMVETVAASTPIRFKTHIALIDDTFSEESEVIFYRIVQECVNNIIKHSEAAEAEINIIHGEKDIVIKISDNGRGFVPAAAAAASMKKQSGFGLIGMAERVRMIGGSQSIETGVGRGTTVTVKIELPNE